jgi:hypothetical protein
VFGFVDDDLNRWRRRGGRAFARLLPETGVGIEGLYAYGCLDFKHGIGGEIRRPT